MAREREAVLDFRNLVDGVVSRNTPRNNGSKTNQALSRGLTFVSVRRRDPRPPEFGRGYKHLWGVSSVELSDEGRIGSLAVVSRLKRGEEGLVRRWRFPTVVRSEVVVTEKRLDDPQQVADIVNWARFPSQHGDVLRSLIELDPVEVADIEPQFTEIAEYRASNPPASVDIANAEAAMAMPPFLGRIS